MVDLTWSWLEELIDDVIDPGDAYVPLGERAARIRRIPPCPEDPERPGPDRWMERRSGILRTNNAPNPDRILPSFRNGRYQHLMFLGVGGFVLCNHCDKEILLVDPWPTCFSHWTRVTSLQRFFDGHLEPTRRELSEGSTPRADQARQRIAHLASFLRKAVEQEYTLSGILISHMHFDHTDDIVLLLELLAAAITDVPSEHVLAERARWRDDSIGTYRDHRDRGGAFLLAGPAVDIDGLPKLCCDYDTMIYLLTYGFYKNYNDIEIDGDVRDTRDVLITRGTQASLTLSRVPRSQYRTETTDSRFWSGNEAWKDILIERINNPADHFINSNTPAWQAVKERYINSIFRTPTMEDTGQGEQNIIDNDSWIEISVNRRRLHYDDSYNMWLDPGDRCKAGQRGTEFELGHFKILPYVWDHSNTGCNWLGMKTRPGQADQTAGNLQRASAFMIWRKDVEGAKRTFIVGSGGEMHSEFTDSLAEPLPVIETDLLIQAILPHLPRWLLRSLSGFDEQIPYYIDFMVRNIRFRTPGEAAVIFIHFEDFIRRVPDPEHYLESFHDSIGHNLDVIREKIEELREEGQTMQAGYYQALFNRNRFYVLGRRGFEYNFPYHILRRR